MSNSQLVCSQCNILASCWLAAWNSLAHKAHVLVSQITSLCLVTRNSLASNLQVVGSLFIILLFQRNLIILIIIIGKLICFSIVVTYEARVYFENILTNIDGFIKLQRNKTLAMMPKLGKIFNSRKYRNC